MRFSPGIYEHAAALIGRPPQDLPATLLLEKDPRAVEAGARRAVDLARRHPNTSVGCGVVPFETRPETILHLQTIIES